MWYVVRDVKTSGLWEVTDEPVHEQGEGYLWYGTFLDKEDALDEAHYLTQKWERGFEV